VREKRKNSNIKFWGKQLGEKNKEQNKSDEDEHWHTEAYKLFRSNFLRFKFSFTINYVNA